MTTSVEWQQSDSTLVSYEIGGDDSQTSDNLLRSSNFYSNKETGKKWSRVGSIKAIGKGQAESGEGKKRRYEGNECIKLYKMSIPYSARHFFPSFSGQKN